MPAVDHMCNFVTQLSLFFHHPRESIYKALLSEISYYNPLWKKKNMQASRVPGNNALSTSKTVLFNNHKLFQVIWHQFNCAHKNVLNNNNKKK